MLDAWIIEELRRREEELEELDRPFLELPIDFFDDYDCDYEEEAEEEERGVVEIQL